MGGPIGSVRRPRFYTCDMMLSRPSQEHLTGNESIMQDHLRAAVFTRFLLRGFVCNAFVTCRHSHILQFVSFLCEQYSFAVSHMPVVDQATHRQSRDAFCFMEFALLLSAKHRPRIDPKYSGFVRARPLSTAHLSMISVNNQRQHVGGEGRKQKYGARGMNTRTRLCNQRAERH